MIDHMLLKHTHMACAVLSITGFLIRSALMLRDSELIWNRVVRTLPHFIDTLLLLTGFWMAWNLHLSASSSPWLVAKLVALVLYVVLGAFALRYGKTKGQRILALVLALLVFAYIASAAVTRSVFLS